MAKHHPDLVMCRKQPGIAIGRLCEKCKAPPRCRRHRAMASPTGLITQAASPDRALFQIGSIAVCFFLYAGDGKCVICDSYVRPAVLTHICDECNYGSYEGRCVICGGPGISDAYYCRECCQQEKDRDGCPKIVNLGSSKTDLFYERKKYGFKKR